LKSNNIFNLYLLCLSIAIGILAAAGALLFRQLIDLFQHVLWPGNTSFYEMLNHCPPWLIVLIPTTAGLIAGPLITCFIPEARGTGIPEVIVSVTGDESTIRHRVTFLKSFITALLIGSGASLGREGPIVQIGASIGSSLASISKRTPDVRRVCLASGAAAGIAATFNAPITGTFFAIEIILMDIEIAHISHIMISSIIASLLSRLFWGELPTFALTSFELLSYYELFIYLFLGLLTGLLAIFFICLIYSTDSLFIRLPLPDWLKPAIGGLLLGMLALKLPQIMGVGYETVIQSLNASLTLQMALILLVAKIVATALCIGSGMSGGIFAPSLVTGATLGTSIGIVSSMMFPEMGLNAAHYALVGMGGMVAGTTLAPITAILTIFELTYNYHMILPLMLTCITSTFIVRLLFGYSVYEMKLIKRGINIVRGHDALVLRSLRVQDFMTREYETLQEATPLTHVVKQAIQSLYPHFVVLNTQNELTGVLSLRDLKNSLSLVTDLKDLIVAADIMTRNVITITPQSNLETALYLFERHHISFLPVMDPQYPLEVAGILKKDVLLQAYKERVLKDRILSSSVK
jgi:CIC family chloride channel protein